MKELEQAGIVCKNETGDWKPDDDGTRLCIIRFRIG